MGHESDPRSTRRRRAGSDGPRRPDRTLLLLGAAVVLLAGGVAAGSLTGAFSGAGGSASPTASRTATSSPSADASQTLEFEPIPLAGTGDAKPTFTVPEGSAAIAAVVNHGTGPFTLRTVGAGGDPGQPLVDSAGDYAGLLLFDARVGQHSVAFDVRSGGSWTIRVEPLGLAPIWSAELPLSGTGDDVALLDTPADGTTALRIQHPGMGPIAVFAYTTSGDLDQLVDTTGALDEAHAVPAGTVCIEVRAVGRWTLSPA